MTKKTKSKKDTLKTNEIDEADSNNRGRIVKIRKIIFRMK